jgi:site-specific recombinase XerD
VFVTRHNTPLTTPSLLYSTLMDHCSKAGIETRRVDSDGHEIDHVDVHSLRRTFATDLIVNGADPKSVQELLGHKTLEMTMNIYAKVQTETKRQVMGRLNYGRGAQTPAHVVEFPGPEKSENRPLSAGKKAADMG